jgi:hypothetical protein
VDDRERRIKERIDDVAGHRSSFLSVTRPAFWRADLVSSNESGRARKPAITTNISVVPALSLDDSAGIARNHTGIEGSQSCVGMISVDDERPCRADRSAGAHPFRRGRDCRCSYPGAGACRIRIRIAPLMASLVVRPAGGRVGAPIRRN